MPDNPNRGDTPRVPPAADNTPKRPDPDVQQKMESVRSANEAKEPKPAKDQEPASGQRVRRPPEAPPAEEKPKPPEDNRVTPEEHGRRIGLEPRGL